MSQVSTPRKSNFELLRLVSIFLILLMHCYAQAPAKSLSTANYFLGFGINAVGNIAVSCFVLLSGYFAVRFKGERFLQLIYLTVLYTAITALLRYGWASEELLRAVLGIVRQSNAIWFIVCYLLLQLLSPFINPFLEQLSRARYHRLLFIGFIVFNVLTTFLPPFGAYVTVATGKSLAYFLYLYAIGRYLRLHTDAHPSAQRCLLGFGLSTLTIFVGNLTLSHISHKMIYPLSVDASPLILFSALCVFYWAKTWSIQSRAINWVASSVVAVYLLDQLRYFLDAHIFHLATSGKNALFPLLLLGEIASVFVLAILFDKLRARLFSRWENRLFASIEERATKLLDRLLS